MMRGLYLSGVAVLMVGAFVILLTQLSEEARLRRRRRKNHARLISKTRKPSVRFSVKPPKE